jgi:hypothetical protein
VLAQDAADQDRPGLRAEDAGELGAAFVQLGGGDVGGGQGDGPRR